MLINKERDVQEILKEFKRGVAEVIGEEQIIKLIKNYYEKGENFYIKAGFDPTAPDLHLGHSVVLFKMAFLQRHGAIVQFLIGDFTARIGDPSGKSATRKVLSKEDVLKNAKTYEEQVFKILDPNKTKILFNSSWCEELGSAGIISLCRTYSVARMLERDDFSKRFKEESPISISEFLYPLLQGYDSVMLKNDIEMGGIDQKFNLLVGRNLQRIYEVNKEQSIIMMPLLVGLDGVNKMSKSLNNYIGITEDPNSMYAKILSISDELMWEWYELLSEISLKDLEKLRQDVKDGTIHPKVAKENLAIEIVSKFYSNKIANEAKEEFDNVHSMGKIPTDLEIFKTDENWIVKILTLSGLTKTNSDARRLIKSNAISINQEKIDDEQLKLDSGEYVIQAGKKKFIKVIIL